MLHTKENYISSSSFMLGFSFSFPLNAFLKPTRISSQRFQAHNQSELSWRLMSHRTLALSGVFCREHIEPNTLSPKLQWICLNPFWAFLTAQVTEQLPVQRSRAASPAHSLRTGKSHHVSSLVGKHRDAFPLSVCSKLKPIPIMGVLDSPPMGGVFFCRDYEPGWII